jgi:hypothetical protein
MAPACASFSVRSSYYGFVARRTLDATAINPYLIKICWETTSSQGERPLEDEGKTSQKKRVVKDMMCYYDLINLDSAVILPIISTVQSSSSSSRSYGTFSTFSAGISLISETDAAICSFVGDPA